MTSQHKHQTTVLHDRDGNDSFLAGVNRRDVMETLYLLYQVAVEFKRTVEPTFDGWPDIVNILDYINKNGLPSAKTLSDLVEYRGQL